MSDFVILDLIGSFFVGMIVGGGLYMIYWFLFGRRR